MRIYSFEMEPRHSVCIYERSRRRSRRWRYLCSTPMLALDVVPILGRFETGFFVPDSDVTADVVDSLPDEVLQQDYACFEAVDSTSHTAT
jgi:hypothetical protein